jgi:two-component system, NtrC family, sensor histidine kinase HydH
MGEPVNPEKLPEAAEQTRITSSGEATEVRERVAELLPHMAAGIVVLAADMTISSWNSQAEHLTGYSLEQIMTIGMVQIFEPVEVMQHVVRKVQEGIPTLSEYLHLRHANGQLMPVTVQCSPQRHLGQSDCQVVVAFRTLEPIQDSLRRDEHLHMLGRLASSLSHEIRNPLNAIFLHVDILEEELQQPSPDHRALVAESLTEIKAEISRLDELVQDYLSLARLSDLRRDPVEIGALVEAFVTEMHEQFEARHITLHLEALDDLGLLPVHRNAFRRVLLNLVQNAMDAMPQGGTLTIRGARAASEISLEIRDTGSGIPTEQLPLLFTPFHTTKSEGTGLGLYVVQQIVEAHEGKVEVMSQLERGTTFTILLPLAADDI